MQAKDMFTASRPSYLCAHTPSSSGQTPPQKDPFSPSGRGPLCKSPKSAATAPRCSPTPAASPLHDALQQLAGGLLQVQRPDVVPQLQQAAHPLRRGGNGSGSSESREFSTTAGCTPPAQRRQWQRQRREQGFQCGSRTGQQLSKGCS